MIGTLNSFLKQKRSIKSTWLKPEDNVTAKNWREVRRTLSPEREAKIEARVKAELARLPLAEVRKARALTQTRLAEILRVNQAAISKMEQRTDMYLSTLRSYIEAMGGSLEVRAVFPEAEILLEHIGSEEAPMASAGVMQQARKADQRRMKSA
jgi:DNA-binding XRE family transcriptional regulator